MAHLHIDSKYKATGLGLHLTLNSLGFLAASLITGIFWQLYGAKPNFSAISLLSLLLLPYFIRISKKV